MTSYLRNSIQALSFRSGKSTDSGGNLDAGWRSQSRTPFHGLSISEPSRVHDESNAEPEERIIVGIDFGTTHSAVAWALTSSPDDYEVISQWPGQVGRDWGKVPSDIAYTMVEGEETAGNGSSEDVTYKWGFEVPPLSPNRLSWIKILLDPSQPRPQFVNPKRTVLPHRMKAVDIVTDYLTALKDYTMLTLERRLGKDFLDRSNNIRKVEYVLTVPAVWSDKAKQTTLEAAVRAGLGVESNGGGGGLLRLLSEPESAANYCLRDMQPGQLKVGDCFVVCDAGGGTVDLISYKISSLNPLELNECVVGSGGLCGAVYVDRRFEDFIIRKVGKDTYEKMSSRAKFQMTQYWETYIKRQFKEEDETDTEDEQDFFIPVVGVADDIGNRISSGFLRLARAEVRDIFEPVVAQVIELISKQVIEVLRSAKGPVAAILLVGGFGSSEYLYQQVKKWSGGKITILQPRNAWTAVVRGAVIRGLQGDVAAVQSRLSRRYYGVVHDSPFDPAKHREGERKWHELRCEWVVKHRMQWYIKRGDITTEKKKISFPFYRTINCDEVVGESHQLRTELWVCDEAVAPDKRDSTVRKLCVMTSEPVPVSRFSKHVNEKGQPFYRVDYSLEITVTSGLIIYEMRLEGQGAPIGSVTTRYE